MAVILVIDDNQQFRTMLCEMLMRAGYEILQAADGNDGVKLFKKYRPDLIITDIFMPDKDGIETIIELRKARKDLKIIALSGGGCNDWNDCLNMAKKLGVDRTFKKPVNRAELLNTIRSCIYGNDDSGESLQTKQKKKVVTSNELFNPV